MNKLDSSLRRRVVTFLLVIVTLFVQVTFELKTTKTKSPLHTYVQDDSDLDVFNHELVQTTRNGTVTTYYLNVTSLSWFDESFSSASIWWHQMYINQPDNLNSSARLPIFFFLGLGYNNMPGENATLDYISDISQLATECACITVIMGQVPNNPIKFTVRTPF
jgi:PhoPQ-activated pathogenicity-related protein